MRKTILPLTALLSLSIACTEDEGQNDFCMDKVSAQTATPKERLAGLTCNDLVNKLPLPLSDGYIALQDKNALVFTHCSLSYFGASRLQHNQSCYEKIHDFLGIQPITQCVMEAMSFEGDLSELESMYVSPQKGGAAGCLMIRSRWLGEKGTCQPLGTEIPEMYSCAPHEPAHIFVAGTVLDRDPPWLNEGLAEYVMSQLQEGITLECFADSFRFTSPSQTKVGPYLPLDIGRGEHDRNGTSFDAYLTGGCLWNHLDKGYGHATFRAIMQDVNASRFSEMSFVNNILLDRIGESGIKDLENKFGKDSIKAFE